MSDNLDEDSNLTTKKLNKNLFINNKLQWVSSAASIGFSTIGGTIIAGGVGGVIGCSASIVDEYLIKNNILDKHYLTSSAFWMKTVFIPSGAFIAGVFPAYKLPIYASSAVFSLVAPALTEDFIDFRGKIEVPLDSFLTINRIFDPEEIFSCKELKRIYDKAYESPSEALNIIVNDIKVLQSNKFLPIFFASNVVHFANTVVGNIFISYIANFKTNLFISSLINSHKDALLKFQFSNGNNYFFEFIKSPHSHAFLMQGAKIILAFITKNIWDFVYNKIEHSFIYQQQMKNVFEKAIELILDEKNSRKITADEKGKEIIKNLSDDLARLLFFGANKLNNVITETSEYFFALANLKQLLPESLAPYALTVLPIQFYLKSISEETQQLAMDISDLQTKRWQLLSDIAVNIEQINLRKGERYLEFTHNSLTNRENIFQKKYECNKKFKLNANNLKNHFNQIVDILYFGSKIALKKLDVSQIPLIKISIDKIHNFLSSNINFKIENADLIIAKDRVDKLLDIISKHKQSNVIRTENDENKIYYKNYNLYLKDQSIIKIDYVEFTYGKHYVITGASGCGKTSALIDIEHGLYGDLKSSGEISIGKKSGLPPKIMFLDQKLYFPKESTLLEAIYFPNIMQILTAEDIITLKLEVSYLLQELFIDGFLNNYEAGLLSRLDSTEFKLSAGQEKKIAIVQAILSKPDVLVMDETFTGLDKDSIFMVQEIINKHLPNVTIIIVDHHSEDNNYNGFYDLEIHFEEGLVIEKNIQSKFVDARTESQLPLMEISLNGEVFAPIQE